MLKRSMLFMFALPALMQGFMHAPAGAMLQGIYAKHAGLGLAALGFAVLLTRIFDAVTDPLIGYLSDASYRRTGSRKPWVAVGSVVTVVGLWFLYRPPEDVTIVYFTAWFMCAYLGWTITEIPYRAWSLELTHDYAQRTRVQTWLAVLGGIGAFSFYLVPALGKAIGAVGEGGSSGELDLSTLALSAIIVLILLPIFNLVALWKVPNGVALEKSAEAESPAIVLKSIFGNGPLLVFVLIFILTSIVGGIAQGVTYLFIDSYLGLSSDLTTVIIASVPVSILATIFWGWACNRFEKHRAWAIGVAIAALGHLCYSFVPVGEGGLGPIMIAAMVMFFGQSVNGVAPQAILGDIVDFGTAKFGRNRAGVYYSFFTIISKSVAGIGVALGLLILAHYGFEPNAPEHGPQAQFGMLLSIAYLPALGFLLMTPFMWRFPLDRLRHRQTLESLEGV